MTIRVSKEIYPSLSCATMKAVLNCQYFLFQLLNVDQTLPQLQLVDQIQTSLSFTPLKLKGSLYLWI